MSTWDVVVLLSPMLTLVVGGLALMAVDAFVRERGELGLVSFCIFVVSGGLSLALWAANVSEAPAWVGTYLATDRLSLMFDVIICGGSAFSSLLAGGYLREHDLERGEYYVLLVFSAFGAMILARATDMLTLFIGLETMSLGAYALVGFRRTSSRAAEGAIKYFLLGSFAAALLLFGAALLYGATGQTNLAAIGSELEAGNADLQLVIMGLLFVLVGLAFKVSAVPFHMWTPDAYEGAVTPATTWMSVVVKSAAFAVLIRVLWLGFGDELSASIDTGWPPALAGLAAITMVYGNVAAVAQSSVKRMLAYSSIAHAGYLLLGVVASSRVGGEAISAVLYYLMAYTASNVLAFGSLILLGSKGREAVSYEDLAGVGRRHPLAALPFVLAVLSLMGLPPTAGFFGKYYVFNAAVQAGGSMVLLAILGVVTSAVGAYYYLRVIVYLYMRQPEAGAPQAVPMKSGYVSFALLLSGYFVFRMGLAPSAYLELAIEAARQFVA